MTGRGVRVAVLAVILGGAAACASSAPGARRAAPTGRQADLITAEEIAGTSAANAYLAVETLRPTFLRARSQSLSEAHFPIVYINGQRWGDLESLRNVPASEVVSIRRLNAADAQSRYGMDHMGGALDVVTRRGNRP